MKLRAPESLLLLALCINYADADVLCKGTVVQSIGLGKESSTIIRWTNCGEPEFRSYLKPPYSLVKGNDCSGIMPSAFGLKKATPNGYLIADVAQFGAFFPDALLIPTTKLEKVEVQTSAKEVRIVFRNRSLRLSRTGELNAEDATLNDLSTAVGIAEFIVDTKKLHAQSDQSTILATREHVLIDLYAQARQDSEVSLAKTALNDASSLESSDLLLRLGRTRVEGSTKLANDLLEKLATHRSLLVPAVAVPDFPSNTQYSTGPCNFTMMGFTMIDNHVNIDVSGCAPESFGSMIVNQSYIQGGTQMLDRITWRDVTFVNVDITYNGGPVELSNVRFVHCTFKAPAMSSSTEELLASIVRNPASVSDLSATQPGN